MEKFEKVFGILKVKEPKERSESCALAKSTRVRFPALSGIQSKQVLELVHMDVWGPHRVKSLGGSRYFFTIIDEFSRYAFLYVIKSKEQVFDVFKQFLAQVERETGKKLICVRIDKGMEFCSNKFQSYLGMLGIQSQRTNES